MNNQDGSGVFVGIDVSAKDLAVALGTGDRIETVRNFANSAAGHQQLLRHLCRGQQRVRVCVEASGNYCPGCCVFLEAQARGA